jgi:hypothetical protein
MFLGYYAFAEANAQYVKANLKLIGNDRRSDPLLSNRFPCGNDRAIPSFSLYYIFAMQEYIEYTGDKSLAREFFSKMCDILSVFLNRKENGLIKNFEASNMWNFYDWSPYLTGRLGAEYVGIPDLAVNCLVVMAIERLEKICESIGEKFEYAGVADELRKSIKEKFYDAEKGAFTMHVGKEQYNTLGNAFAVLMGIVSGAEADKICDMIVNGELEDCSLSVKIFEYEALLLNNTEKYKDFILNEIRHNYKIMIDYGSDTVWETLKGESDFHNAGSLCHGWSAIPVYIYHKLGIAKYQ